MSLQKFPDGKVVIETNTCDYDYVLMFMGIALDQLLENHQRGMARNLIALLNRINMGNTEWHPFNLEHYEERVNQKLKNARARKDSSNEKQGTG